MIKGYCYETKIGVLCFVEEDGQLIECTQNVTNNMFQEETDVIKYALGEVIEYLEGNLRHFKTKVKLTGTPFQQSVYHALAQVSYGTTVTYKSLAKAIGKPNSYRAVGNALNKNPLMLFVPCHRVIKSNNTIGGFALDLEIKKTLLTLEEENGYA
ncbi:MAG: methylated-DNA--[protein]-cysteine S-methyltransferase [Bacillota bacterium]